MLLGLVHGQEQTCRLDDILSTNLVPLEVGGVFLGSDTDAVAVDDELVLGCIDLDGAIELAVHGVILEHVSHVVDGQQVIDTHNLNVIYIALLKGRAEHKTTDAAESVNTDFNFSHNN